MTNLDPNSQAIDYLIERGRLERVTPRKEIAEHLVREARRHLASAANLAQTEDQSMALVAAYDAARKSLSAILAVQGIRAKGGDGGHSVLLDAVRPQFPEHRQELQRFDWMRTMRNNTEYPDFDTP
ncbi:MAG: HEPN domain-containing protein, partial [Propionibacteriaceae bacterium]|nr:HEPN domain-containing protein [Propionibacteriaceae bacterium]